MRFNVGDTVYFYDFGKKLPPFSCAMGQYLINKLDTYLLNVMSGTIKEIVIHSDDDIEYIVWTYDIYHHHEETFSMKESSIFHSKSDCIINEINVIISYLNDIANELKEIKTKI